METASGSGSLTDSANSNPPSPPTESVNGLKFGKKIYFEDLGMGAPHKSPAPSRPPPPGSGAPIRKGPGGQQHQQQPPRCQVEGCNVDLSDAKAYYSRHKVCGMHSKSPHVLVAGLQQRFCQQCSRFHQLPEFDQGKRSCCRRLAGHNARRRKQPPGSVLSSRHGRFSSTIFDNSSRVGSFLVDFSAYPRHTGRDAWPGARSSEQVTGNQVTPTARSVPHPWQNSLQNPPSNLYLQASASETGFPGPEITPGECFTGFDINTDSSCALSLLSNQPWDSRMNELVNAGAPVPQSTVPRSAAHNHYPNWGLKDHEAGSSSHQMHPDLGLGQIPQPLSDQFAGELELSQQSTRQYMELEHSRSYDSSTPHINWLL